MLSFYLPAFVVALAITLLEMTEVVAVVFALSADQSSVRPGAWGAVAGTSLVAAVALVAGGLLIAVPAHYFLLGAAVILAAFGGFLLRGTIRAYRWSRQPRSSSEFLARKDAKSAVFAGGFTVGVVESIEAVIVLLALTVAGYGFSALLGALVGGATLVGLLSLIHI